MLDISITHGVAEIVINRPEVRNALSPALLESLISRCNVLSGDTSTRVVLFRGAQGHFSGGADLQAFASRIHIEGEEIADLGHRAITAVCELPQITIAHIEGACVGGGLVLAGACELRLSTPDARFSLPELMAGIPVAWGGMAILHRILGESRLLDLVLSGRTIDAEEALRMGIITRYTDLDGARHSARRLASYPQSTLRTIKKQMQGLRSGTFQGSEDAQAVLHALRDPEVLTCMQAYMSARFKS